MLKFSIFRSTQTNLLA